MSMMPSNELMKSALSRRAITLVYAPFFPALCCLFYCMVPILPAIIHLVSSGVNSVGNPFNTASL